MLRKGIMISLLAILICSVILNIKAAERGNRRGVRSVEQNTVIQKNPNHR